MQQNQKYLFFSHTFIFIVKTCYPHYPQCNLIVSPQPTLTFPARSVCVCVHTWESLTLHIVCVFLKLLSGTAAPLFPSHTPSLAQLPLTAHSHDPPTLLPAFTFSSAWLASEKQRPALSPALAFPLCIVGRPANTSPGLWLHPGGSGQNQQDKLWQQKRLSCVFSPASVPLFFIVSALLINVGLGAKALDAAKKKKLKWIWKVSACWAKRRTWSESGPLFQFA